MVELYGRTMSRRELAESSGATTPFFGVRLMTLGDGLERGIRMLEFRTGTGLRFTVLVDRALDIADLDYRGVAIGWHSPTGFRHPGLHEYEGEGGLGWLRSFSGLLCTAGLDHILFMDEEPADHYLYQARETVKHSIHGRVSTIPARLNGYGERWEGDRCFLWCEGTVAQASMFGENLELVRRVEVEAGTDEIRICDRVTNRGFYETPHMYLYHVQVGYPLLAAGSRYLAPITDVVCAGHAGETYRARGIGYRTMAAPQHDFLEQVWQHEVGTAGDGRTCVALVNDALGLGFEVGYRKDQFPCLIEWQNLQAGSYALGLEPATNHVPGRAFARARNEMIRLAHGEERRYDVTFRVLPNAAAIAEAEAAIRAIAVQPDEDYPEPSGNHVALTGRG